METIQQNGRFTLFSSKFYSNIYSILYVKLSSKVTAQLAEILTYKYILDIKLEIPEYDLFTREKKTCFLSAFKGYFSLEQVVPRKQWNNWRLFV